jgi:AhpD family alkylhydroperoxidase
MSARLNYYHQSPKAAAKYQEFSNSLKNTQVPEKLKDLIFLRASQINGCAFCVDMHVKEAKIHGERELRLHHVAVWRESPLFDERERAALEWTELVTQLPPHGISDESYARMRAVYSEQETADITFVVVAINGWNRLSIAFRAVPGSADAAFGLDKAGLN